MRDDDALREPLRFIDDRTGGATFARKALRYVFPDHWSFLLGEVVLYAFVVLVATGIYLALFFEPSLSDTIYTGPYAPLQGAQMSDAYRSAVDLSFSVKAGLLMRQTHHWAADVFVAAMVLHLLRVVFTGAFRRPRELTYVIGVLMLFIALVEGYLGYSLVDDLLSGMGLAIGYSVLLSVPVIGGNLGELLWGAPFPGDPAFESRMYIAHVLLIPGLLAVLIGGHLALIASRHHTQFRGRLGQSNGRLVGVPAFPGQAPRSLGLLAAVAAVLLALGGLVQINPIWLWGPYETGLGTNGAQPDWYLGWLIGALRLMPGFDVTAGSYTVIPNPFWGGILFPTVVVAVLLAFPWLERRWTGDRGRHNLLDRPRDAPGRTGFGVAFLLWVFLIFVAGSADRATVFFGLDYETQIKVYRVLVWVLPVIAFFVVRRFCRALQRAEAVERVQHAAEAEAAAEVERVP
ncbi:MAG TPA: cytochrome b N-terminal domain-containing protein [Solirubrobacteraceae bacterium]|nr:cytochrome b N-terminal domain-containing protein [Solirubrobacteraceae bacterium]